MNGIFFSEGLELNKADKLGIERKVVLQIECLKKIGNVTSVNLEINKNDKLDRLKFILPFVKSNREKKREKLIEVVNDTTDYIYIRKPSLTIAFYKLLKKIKRKYPQIYIMLEIPTYPFHSEYKGISKLMILKSVHCEKKLKNVIDKIITYSDDEVIWGIPTLKTCNCVSYRDITPRSLDYKIKDKCIRMTCVANFMYWHGADRLINAIISYKGDYKIYFNLVGEGKEIDKLKKLARRSKNIIFHGSKMGEELTKVFNETDIAIDALGRHRSGVYYNSSLKGKEYLARGIPVISAVKTELDSINDFKYYLRIPANESPIDINEIIKFFNNIYKNNEGVITTEIRNFTERKFDYKYGFEEKIRTILADNLKYST